MPVKISWLNSWEFRDNLSLGFEGIWVVPYGGGLDLNLTRLFSRSDFSPFAGGGWGSFWKYYLMAVVVASVIGGITQ